MNKSKNKEPYRTKSATISLKTEQPDKDKFLRFQKWLKEFYPKQRNGQTDMFNEGMEVLYEKYGFEQGE